MSDSKVHPFDLKKLRKKTIFKPRARIIRLLGEELISSEIVALTELIKNAHDSDATNIEIDFEGLRENVPTIKLTDNGDGMEKDIFLSDWLQFGGSWKRDKLFTEKGRPLLGQMGVGRFAADKLADKLYLISRSKKNGLELHAYVDWNKFDPHRKMLSDLKILWDMRKPILFSGNKHGTQLIMKGSRVEWNENKLKDLVVSLASIVHPFGNQGKFDIQLNTPDYPSLSGKLSGLAFEDAHYSIKAYLEYDGIVSCKIDNKSEYSFLWKKNGGRRTGPVTVSIFVWDLENRRDLREPVSLEMRRLLRKWNGMLIFRDGFRVWPFGKNGDDWMGLDRRRVDNPTLHLGNNQLMGLINISSRYNRNLRDLTNREGMRETEAIWDLRDFITQAVLPPLEAHRRKIRKTRQISLVMNELSSEHSKRYEKIKNIKKSLQIELNRIEKNIKKRKEDLKRLNNYSDTLRYRLSELI